MLPLYSGHLLEALRKCKCSEGRLRSGLKVDSFSAVLSLTGLINSLFLSTFMMKLYGALIVFMTLSTGKNSLAELDQYALTEHCNLKKLVVV